MAELKKRVIGEIQSNDPIPNENFFPFIFVDMSIPTVALVVGARAIASNAKNKGSSSSFVRDCLSVYKRIISTEVQKKISTSSISDLQVQF